ncbi:MAG: NADH:flavin oxidoreductase, partial [Rubripirellula sp.]
MAYPRIASFKTHTDFVDYLRQLNLDLPCDQTVCSPSETPLASPIELDGCTIGNRFCILPMEGWDGTRAGKPTELTRRRWRNFGLSGAK